MIKKNSMALNTIEESQAHLLSHRDRIKHYVGLLGDGQKADPKRLDNCTCLGLALYDVEQIVTYPDMDGESTYESCINAANGPFKRNSENWKNSTWKSIGHNMKQWQILKPDEKICRKGKESGKNYWVYPYYGIARPKPRADILDGAVYDAWIGRAQLPTHHLGAGQRRLPAAVD